jgi:hypothetical protein
MGARFLLRLARCIGPNRTDGQAAVKNGLL